MIRRFLSDIRGNYFVLTAAAMVPIMGALALAVDYSELTRQRAATMNALDAANIATAARLIGGATEEQAKAYAKDFFEANLGPVKASNTTLIVTLPSNNAGGGTLKLEAELKYHPYFLPAAAMLIGKTSGATEVDFSAKSEVRLKNTLEVALVLDNSGSMNEEGSGTDDKRIVLLRDAAKELVETLALQAAQMKQIEKPVQFALVPFSASVNVAPDIDDKPWLDTMGISPVHHENFDWSQMTEDKPNLLGDRFAKKVGDVWYKKGAGWGLSENQAQALTRFSLYEDIIAQADREAIPNTKRRVCKTFKKGKCEAYTDEPEYEYSVAQYTSWQGCVEARPVPYNNNDVTPTTSEPATLFVPMFAPDEAKHLWRDLNDDGEPDLNNDDFDYGNNWWADWSDGTAKERQTDMRKYFRVKPYEASAAGSGDGPNSSCTTTPITPLTDVTVAEGKEAILDAIDDMEPTGNTNVPEGTAWGWRVVSSNEPFTQGRPNEERGNDKVVIVLTDGANTYGDQGGNDDAKNRSTYAAYGYVGKKYGATDVTRLFTGTSDEVGKTDYTASNYQEAMDEQMQKLCTNAKASNVLLMTVALDLSESVDAEKKAIAALTTCASDFRFRKDPPDPTDPTAPAKPAKLFWNATGATLSKVFKEIADELSNLRIVG